MPLFMDVHSLGAPVALNDAAHAHAADLQHQDAHDVHELPPEVLLIGPEPHGKLFCLVEAPDADTATAVHREAHGLVADEIYQVQEGA